MKVLVGTKDIVRLAAPISVALLIPQLNFLTNTAFLGRLGERELGVNGISGVFYLILAMVGYGLSSGLQVLMARRVGEGNKEGLGRLFGNGIILSVLFSLFLILMSLWFAPIVFGSSLQSTENVYLSISFLYVRVWGLPFLMLTQLVNAFFIATSRSKYLVIGSAIGTVINIVLDYLFIFGKGGFPAMGMQGAAIASVIAEGVACLVMWSIFVATKSYRQYNVEHILRFDWKLASGTLKVASPLIVQYFFSIGGWQVFFIFVEHLGPQDLAASQMLRSVLGIVGVCTWAFASSCNTLVSRIIGQGLQNRVPWLIWKIARISLVSTVAICLLFLLFSRQFLGMYTTDPGLIQFAIPSLRVVALATITMSIATVVFNGVVGTGNTLVNLTIEITCVLAYLVYCYVFIERLRMPLYIAWGSEFIYWLSLFFISLWYLRSGRWKGKVI